MLFTLISLFPEMFNGPFDQSIIKRAQNSQLVTINIVNLRDFANDSYRTVDGKPYGGGQGMILRVDIIDRCLNHILNSTNIPRNLTRILITDPRGHTYNQKVAKSYTRYHHLIILCGHYEGFDERVLTFVDEQISIGEFILTGGEIPAMAIVDSVVRLIPKVLKNPESIKDESYNDGVHLEYPQYTEPRDYFGEKVPEILLTGHHKNINSWKLNHKKPKD
jgi:tRNA (guanine37-N1)-methyltransferase